MSSYFGKQFDRVVRWLRVHSWPLMYTRFYVKTVKELSVDGENCFAEVRELGDGSWLIKIHRNQEYNAAVDCLLHELAHIIDWERNGYVEGHDQQHRTSFGIIWSELYRAYHIAAEKGEI